MLKKTSLKLTALSYFLLLTSTLYAQCPSCDQALQRDTRDYYTNVLKSDFTSVLQEIFSHDYAYYETGEWTKNTALQSGGSYGIISGFLNGNQSSAEKKAKFESMKTSFSRNQSIQSDLYQFAAQSVNSGKIYDSWANCIKSCNDPHLDMPVLTTVSTGSTLTVNLYWKSNNGNDRNATIRDITYGNLDPTTKGSLFVTAVIEPRNSYSKTFRIQDIHQLSYITVNVSGFDPATIQVAPVPIENLGVNSPIGTIVASVLDFERFCKLNGQPTTIVYDDSLHCIWVPADGRSVLGSRYGRYENFVPDLRGVFLRAMNDFGVLGVQSVGSAQAETNADGTPNNRPANNFEQDEFKRHIHQMLITDGWYGPLSDQHNIHQGDDRTGATQSQNSSIIQPAGTSSETRPKNISVYYYIKIN